MAAQDVQFEAMLLQVAHTGSQGSHVLVAAFMTVVLGVQVMTQLVPSRNVDELHERQAVWVVHVTQGATHGTHKVGFWLVSGYEPESHCARQVPVEAVLFK